MTDKDRMKKAAELHEQLMRDFGKALLKVHDDHYGTTYVAPIKKRWWQFWK